MGPLATCNRVSAGGSQAYSAHQASQTKHCMCAYLEAQTRSPRAPTPSNTYLLCARPSTVFYMILTGGEAVLLFTSFPGQAHPSWVLVLVHSCKQGMLRHFSSLGLNFLLYKRKLRILDVSPLLRRGKMLNVVAGNPRGPRCGSGWIRAIQPLFREVAQGDSGWLSYSAAVQRNGLCGRLMGFWEWGRVSHRVTFKLFSEQAFLTLSRELERW